VIPNPYDEGTFRRIPGIRRDRDLVFVGRLIPEKGADLLLEAAAALLPRSLTVTIVGDGPMRAELEARAKNLGIQEMVCFSGAKQGGELARILNRHRIQVVPSRWQEPFGIVTLEGIACGCAVVGSDGGGLPDAIGPCGVTFRNDNASELARALGELLDDDAKRQELGAAAAAHLARHHPRVIAESYLEELAQEV
jgi:glycosyltransferase involved in cell wall biosynthesis